MKIQNIIDEIPKSFKENNQSNLKLIKNLLENIN